MNIYFTLKLTFKLLFAFIFPISLSFTLSLCVTKNWNNMDLFVALCSNWTVDLSVDDALFLPRWFLINCLFNGMALLLILLINCIIAIYLYSTFSSSSSSISSFSLTLYIILLIIDKECLLVYKMIVLFY